MTGSMINYFDIPGGPELPSPGNPSGDCECPLPLYDHTIAAGEVGSPPPSRIFRSTVDDRIYNRQASGSTSLLDNVISSS